MEVPIKIDKIIMNILPNSLCLKRRQTAAFRASETINCSRNESSSVFKFYGRKPRQFRFIVPDACFLLCRVRPVPSQATIKDRFRPEPISVAVETSKIQMPKYLSEIVDPRLEQLLIEITRHISVEIPADTFRMSHLSKDSSVRRQDTFNRLIGIIWIESDI